MKIKKIKTMSPKGLYVFEYNGHIIRVTDISVQVFKQDGRAVLFLDGKGFLDGDVINNIKFLLERIKSEK